MNQLTNRKGLVVLNAALLLVLAAVTLAPATHAQQKAPATGARPRGEYTMVSGKITGASSNAVYLVDANNEEVLTLLWNQTSRGLDVISYRDMRADSTAQPGR